ncbi:ODV-E18 [Perigonia lusca single nucleopolyhedrovirus]|uniref:ODV-E18 n=1 Tax=Perigonia lusca single nucleopolyhedrovirus TaxID=1675865 RepID=A0A0M3N1X5_9ABAC|nr:ODV-E18 [Perigonia lusca single nucleopolyhedrovirus]AKN80554.1 ODV-E18 [Perigonia lusca single nucleopolyhedrovirus]
MEDMRPPTTNATGRFMANNPTFFNTSFLMTVLIVLVIVILLIMLFQSSSAGTGSSATDVTRFGYTNPLNATMRANPFVNTPQRTML